MDASGLGAEQLARNVGINSCRFENMSLANVIWGFYVWYIRTCALSIILLHFRFHTFLRHARCVCLGSDNVGYSTGRPKLTDYLQIMES